MDLIPVNNARTRRAFLELPIEIYRDNPYWIRPLDKDIEAVFDPEQNNYFDQGEARRWILEDGGEIVGRIAAFYNHRLASEYDRPTGGLGFFECIDDEQAARALFDGGIEWLRRRDMEAVIAPVNFGEREKWWGLLVEGYDREPNYRCNYHLPYYRALFEDYGFEMLFRQFTYGRPISRKIPTDDREIARQITSDDRYHFEHVDKSALPRFAKEFSTVYNRAWSAHEAVPDISTTQARSLVRKLEPIMDEDITLFAYFEEEPVGFFICIPDLNQIFKHLDGRMNWFGKLKFLWHQWRGTCRKMLGLVFGIVPSHQGTGLKEALIGTMYDRIEPLDRYDFMEMNWIGEFNPKMMHLAESIGGETLKIHHTYELQIAP